MSEEADKIWGMIANKYIRSKGRDPDTFRGRVLSIDEMSEVDELYTQYMKE